MKNRTSWMTILMIAGVASISLAQEPIAAKAGASHMHSAFGFVAAIDRKVGLSPEQKDAVRGLLADQRQKSQALRQDTDSKIRALLNADQQKKFDEVLAEQKARRPNHK